MRAGSTLCFSISLSVDEKDERHRAILDLGARLRLETELSERAGREGARLRPLDVVIDLPEPVSFETDLQVLAEEGTKLGEQDTRSLFDLSQQPHRVQPRGRGRFCTLTQTHPRLRRRTFRTGPQGGNGTPRMKRSIPTETMIGPAARNSSLRKPSKWIQLSAGTHVAPTLLRPSVEGGRPAPRGGMMDLVETSWKIWSRSSSTSFSITRQKKSAWGIAPAISVGTMWPAMSSTESAGIHSLQSRPGLQ